MKALRYLVVPIFVGVLASPVLGATPAAAGEPACETVSTALPDADAADVCEDVDPQPVCETVDDALSTRDDVCGDIADKPDVCGELARQVDLAIGDDEECVPPVPPVEDVCDDEAQNVETSLGEGCVPPVPPVEEVCDAAHSGDHSWNHDCVPPVDEVCGDSGFEDDLEECTPDPTEQACQTLYMLDDTLRQEEEDDGAGGSPSPLLPCVAPPPPPDVCAIARDTVPSDPSWSPPPTDPVARTCLVESAPGTDVVPKQGWPTACSTPLVGLNLPEAVYYVELDYWNAVTHSLETACFYVPVAVPTLLPYSPESARAVLAYLELNDPVSPTGATLTIERELGACLDSLTVRATVDIPDVGRVTTGYEAPTTPQQFVLSVSYTEDAQHNIDADATIVRGCTASYVRVPVKALIGGSAKNVGVRFEPMPGSFQAEVGLPTKDTVPTEVVVSAPEAPALSIDTGFGGTDIAVRVRDLPASTSVWVAPAKEPLQVTYSATGVASEVALDFDNGTTEVAVTAVDVPTKVEFCLDGGGTCDEGGALDQFSVSITGSGPVTVSSFSVAGKGVRVWGRDLTDLSGLTFHYGEYWNEITMVCTGTGVYRACEYGSGPPEPVPSCEARLSGSRSGSISRYLRLDTGGRRVTGELHLSLGATKECDGTWGTPFQLDLEIRGRGMSAEARELHWKADNPRWLTVDRGTASCPALGGGPDLRIDLSTSGAFVDAIIEHGFCASWIYPI